MKDRARGAIAALACLCASQAAAADIEFSESGGAVPAHQTAVLQADVVCEYRCSSDPSIVCNGEDDRACDDE